MQTATLHCTGKRFAILVYEETQQPPVCTLITESDRRLALFAAQDIKQAMPAHTVKLLDMIHLTATLI